MIVAQIHKHRKPTSDPAVIEYHSCDREITLKSLTPPSDNMNIPQLIELNTDLFSGHGLGTYRFKHSVYTAAISYTLD